MRRSRAFARLGALAGVLSLAACAHGPAYEAPRLDLPPAWRVDPPWRESAPSDVVDKGPWWQRYGDARLDELESRALANSPNLELARARLAQARSQLANVSASLFPQIGLATRVQRLKTSKDRPLSGYGTPNYSVVQDDYAAALNVNYEVDLAGRVSSGIQNARASAEQSASDLVNTRLILGTDLATAYFNLRGIDAELDVLDRSVALQRRALDFITQRHDLGATSGLEVAQQQALLDGTLTQVEILRRLRDPFEHALATLTGTPAPSFSLAPDLRQWEAPAIPLGVPSDVLERRPDVASAERAMAAANAQIGVAKAAFYPSIMLAPSYGFESRNLGALFDAPSVLWALGVTATQLIFDGGRARSGVDFANAGYDATVAAYRRTVLTAMQEVEDGITGVAALDRATAQSQVAVGSARRVLELATSRYEGGAATYLDVTTAQQSLLGVERQTTQLESQRRVTSVFLIKALGGDWEGAPERQSSSH